MTNEDMIFKMIEMQKALDNAIYKGHNTEFDYERSYLALIDEVGELTHELKAKWCWWKKTQAPVDNAKVLEELVDVWHFVLSIKYHQKNYTIDDSVDSGVEIKSKLNIIIHSLIDYDFRTYIDYYAYALTVKLGFTMQDVYKAYIEKNRENYRRLESGY